jgi:hypothetical protein
LVDSIGQLLSLLFVLKVKSELPLVKAAVKERWGFEVRNPIALYQL